MKRKHVNVIFPNTKDAGPRSWGQEKILSVIPETLSLKLLHIKAGSKGGLQYHRKKNECGYLLKGKLIIRFDIGDGKLQEKILKPGSSFHFPPGAVHQEEALEDCEIIEASTPHFNDRVRVEDEYGIKDKDGLPTTNEEDIILK